MSDADIKKVVDRWVAVAKESDQEVVTVEVAVCDPPYPAYMVRDIYEAACAKDAELIQRFVDHNAKWVGNGCLEADREWDDIVSDCIAAGFRPTV